MAENEIIKHAGRVYRILKRPEGKIISRVIDITIEILIIVFAVSVSIWFHNRSTLSHERKEAVEFLEGFKKDLSVDLKNLGSSKQFYENTLAGIKYFLRAGSRPGFDRDSVGKYSDIFFAGTDLDPNIARYEGLKNSGKFRIIRNAELLNDIIELHEVIFKRIEELNQKYDRNKGQIEDLISGNVKFGADGRISNTGELIRRSDFSIRMFLGRGLIEYNILQAHVEGITKCKAILAGIDRELKQ